MEFSGIVEKGSRAAGAMGFPTVNIPFDGSLSGIYVAYARIAEDEHPAAVYADPKRKVLEAHLLDFSGDLYGKSVTLRIVEKLREDRVFTDLHEAKTHITEDIAKAREYFKV
jgi:riboflavin kinase/FMN adenylyltransferase